MNEPQPINELITSGRQVGTTEQTGAVKQSHWQKIIRALVNKIRPSKVRETVASRYDELNSGQKVAVVGGVLLTAAGAVGGTAMANKEQLNTAVNNAGKAVVSTGEMLSQNAIKLDNEDFKTSSAGTQSKDAAKQMQIRDVRLSTPQTPQGENR